MKSTLPFAEPFAGEYKVRDSSQGGYIGLPCRVHGLIVFETGDPEFAITTETEDGTIYAAIVPEVRRADGSNSENSRA